MIKMFRKLFEAFSPRTIKSCEVHRKAIDERITKLEKATLNGEGEWMLKLHPRCEECMNREKDEDSNGTS